MSNRLLLGLAAAPFLFAGVALAQTGTSSGSSSGTSSGPSAGKNVEPSAASQKREGRSADESMAPGGTGTTGIEAKPGVQSGEMPKSNMNSNSKPQ